MHWPYYCANSVLILFPSILSCPWTPYRSCTGGMEMGIIPCIVDPDVCIKRPLPSICVFHSLHFFNRIEIKHAFVFIKIIFPLNWRFYFVSIGYQGTLVRWPLFNPAYPLSTWTNTLTCQEGIDSSFVGKSFGRVLLMYKSCLRDGWCPLSDEVSLYGDRTSLLVVVART